MQRSISNSTDAILDVGRFFRFLPAFALVPSSLVPQTSALATRAASPTSGFAELDERLVVGHRGVLVVSCPGEVQAPLAQHAARRLRAAGLLPVVVRERSGSTRIGDAATCLGLGALPPDPAAAAELVAASMRARHAALVMPMSPEGSWDAAVSRHLADAEPPLCLLFLAGRAAPGAPKDGVAFEVAAELAPGDKLRWLSAVAEEAIEQVSSTDLGSLESWWIAARAQKLGVPRRARSLELSSGARSLLERLTLAGRSLRPAAFATLASGDDASALADELVAAGVASRWGEGLAAEAPPADASEADGDARLAVARLLAGETPGSGFEPDPWAYARAAELFLEAKAFEQADVAAERAAAVDPSRWGQGAGGDASIAAELGGRWFDAVRPVGGPDGARLRLRAGERALRHGDAKEALRWAESASAVSQASTGDGASIAAEFHLLMGRTLVQLGDLVAARVCFAKAEAASGGDDELEARVHVERGEAAYLGGELDMAAELADRAHALGRAAATRLAARSTLGKVLLARGAWDLADAHFAEDTLTAAAAGEATAELRARLNRAIALMSKGMLVEARGLLERVLEDATRLREERARAFALSNLGLVAYRQHDYGSALQYWDLAIRLPQALRGRHATVLTIGNLADLRLRLGLVEHAEHAIAFGRRLLGDGAAPRGAALFKWVSAQIALARRDTELARREIEAAIGLARASGDRIYLESAYVVASRVALEDGDLGRTVQALTEADAVAKSPRAKAEVAIVRAAHQRACGLPATALAHAALTCAQTAGEEDLLFEIHALLALVHRDDRELELARIEAGRAIAIRDQVAAGLPPDVRTAFLAKPDVVAASRLFTSLSSASAKAEHVPPNSQTSAGLDALGVPSAGLDALGVPSAGLDALGVPSAPRLAPPRRDEPRELVGHDPQIRSLTLAIQKVARSSSTVLIRGESGTGKELVAEALHRASDRAAGPLVSVNCAALVETLLLSELFGHEKGAFTGAATRRRGRFELAEGGTLFLDEIGDVSPRTQVALLRVLQEKTFERVGGMAPIRADVRVVCATHRDLRAMVERGEFREDLYYRLRGITLEVPALRARLGDVPRLAEHLLGRIAAERGEAPKTLSPDALDLLGRHRWPGNVRELENVLRAVVLFTESEVITTADVVDNVDELRLVAQSTASLARRFGDRDDPPASEALDDESPVLPDDEACATSMAYREVRQGAISLSNIKRQIERDCIARALAETKGNITRAAALLGMKRPRLSQLVKQYGLAAATSSEGSSS
jgi:DNA-binding NtrC family response regulator/tetratricopeptide (TPR) repeat protein